MTVKKIYIELNDEELDFIKHLASMNDLTVDSMLIALCKDKIADELALRRDLEEIVTYRGHVIWHDKELDVYRVAMERDRTDTYYSTLDEAYDAIDNVEDWR